MRALWLLLPFTIACGDNDKVEVGGDDSDLVGTDDSADPTDDSGGGDNDDTGEGPPPCDVSVLESTPADGAVDVDITTDPTFTLSAPDATATITTDIPGTLWVSDDAMTVAWVVDDTLAWETSYTVSVTTCSTTASTSFTTEDAPEPANDLVDRSWVIDLNDATIAEPSALESFVDGSLMSVFLGVSAVDVGTVDMRMALDDGSGNQDTCIASIEWTDFTYDDSDRTFEGWMDEASLPLLGDEPLIVYSLHATGGWNADGSQLSGGVIEGMLDVRDFEEAVGMSGDDICTYGAFLGFTCEDCPDTGETYCLGVRIEDMAGPESGVALIPVAANDCPDCETGEPVCE